MGLSISCWDHGNTSEQKLANFMKLRKTDVHSTATRYFTAVSLPRYCCGREIVSMAQRRLVGTPACMTRRTPGPSRQSIIIIIINYY